MRICWRKFSKGSKKLAWSWAQRSAVSFREIKCLGHVVSEEGIACDPSKTVAVSKWPVPANVKDLQRFLGFTGFYRGFIQDYARVARPLTELLRGSNSRKLKRKKQVNTQWSWGEAQDNAFRALVHRLEVVPCGRLRKIIAPINWNFWHYTGLLPSNSITTYMEHCISLWLRITIPSLMCSQTGCSGTQMDGWTGHL